MKHFTKIFLVLIFAIFLACATTGKQIEAFDDMTDVQKATIFMNAYSDLFDNYQDTASKDDLSVERVENLILVRDMVGELYGLISKYEFAASHNLPIDKNDENRILALIGSIKEKL